MPMLLGHGARPSLGHSTRADPGLSARLLKDIIGISWATQWNSEGARVVTDHLFNDMPDVLTVLAGWIDCNDAGVLPIIATGTAEACACRPTRGPGSSSPRPEWPQT
ncbi:hypothetical protein [Streptomyces sp. SID12501]|uniref:Uncharacterized protein n=1 Tax=Streptomyces sp. SID12501 TaxID=2706042 RepID=A0A6B3BVU2_9ACTN|nr:hypothetical protein [Streptomyces sp. SID12501]NEC88390.1 hypothetical protein [Streptomyces sp. SID12501]